MNVEPLLAAVAAHGLPTAAGIELREPLGDDEWARFHRRVESHRLTGLLALAVAEGAFPLTDGQDAEAGDREVEVATHVVNLERLLLDVVAALGTADIELRVLKGSAFAHTAYAVPEVRPFADADVLIRSTDLDRAGGVLERLGVLRRVPELRPGYDRRFGRTVTCATADGFEVDLHRTLAGGPFTFLVDPDALFDRAASFDLAGTEVPCFDATLGLLHSCVHLVLGGRPRLLTARDVVEHAGLPALDAAAVVALARRWRLTAVVARGLATARDELRLDPTWPGALLDRLRPDAEEVRLLDRVPGEVGHSGELALAALRHVPGLGRKAAFARAHLWPGAEHLRGRGLRRRSHLGGIARRLVGR